MMCSTPFLRRARPRRLERNQPVQCHRWTNWATGALTGLLHNVQVPWRREKTGATARPIATSHRPWVRIGMRCVVERPGIRRGAFVELPARAGRQQLIPVPLIRDPVRDPDAAASGHACLGPDPDADGLRGIRRGRVVVVIAIRPDMDGVPAGALHSSGDGASTSLVAPDVSGLEVLIPRRRRIVVPLGDIVADSDLITTVPALLAACVLVPAARSRASTSTLANIVVTAYVV